MIALPEYVLECDDVLCKCVEHIKACSTATKEANPHTRVIHIKVKKLVLAGRSS